MKLDYASVAAAMEARGLSIVFGLPGTQNVNLFEAFRRSSIRTVLATSELNAAFMAVGYGRASGRPGVLATIPGPGLAYALPGLAEARLDSVPLIHIVVAPDHTPGKRFRHQEIENLRLLSSLVKGVVPAPGRADVETALTRAWDLAVSGEPGPAVLWLGGEEDDSGSEAGKWETRAPDDEGSWESGEARRGLRERVARARRPVLFLGLGAAPCAPLVRELSEALRAPTFTTPSARGTLPEDHPLSLAFDFDRGGLEVLNELLHSSDLILALGCKLSHNGTGGFGLNLERDKFVHVNTDGNALGANYPASLEVNATVEAVASALLHDLPPDGTASEWTRDQVSEWRSRIAASPPGSPPEPRASSVPSGTVKEILGLLRTELPRDAIVVTDSGLHQVLVRRHFQVLAPGGLILPTDFQSMGFGLPAAIGASLAAPERTVVAVVGDGGFSMSGMELLTLARENLPVSVIVFNDGQLNLIRLQQERDFGTSHSVRLKNPDFEVFAEAVGVEFVRLDADVGQRLRGALNATGPYLLDLPLGDSRAIRSVRRKARAKSSLRALLGDSGVERLKSLRKLLGR